MSDPSLPARRDRALELAFGRMTLAFDTLEARIDELEALSERDGSVAEHEFPRAFAYRARSNAHWALHALDVEWESAYRRYRRAARLELRCLGEVALGQAERSLAQEAGERFVRACRALRQLKAALKLSGMRDDITAVDGDALEVLTGCLADRRDHPAGVAPLRRGRLGPLP